MHTELLEILRCPYCGARLELVTSTFHERAGDTIRNGILACECCTFPLVDGIPVLHLQESAKTALAQLDAGQPRLALRAMVGTDDPAQAEQFDAAAASRDSTFRDIVGALGPGFEGGYFLYRFSDPTYVVADALVRAVATVALHEGGRAIDVCGGSGHLTRALVPRSSPAPVLADLFFPKIWLARRFTAPGAIPVCCDGNAPLPFTRGAFRYAMCSDAFMFIWMKRQFIGEMQRLVDADRPGTVLINHTHNQLVWSPSHGQALTPRGYRALFERRRPRLFGESRLFSDVVRGTTLDLTRSEDDDALAAEAALTMIVSDEPGVFARHPVMPPEASGGEWRINPLYAISNSGDRLQGRLTFPSEDYEHEYGACREYLPETIDVAAADVRTLQATGTAPPALADLVRRRVMVELPRKYY
jgi:uncharacterized protein YbaR (Trm112 family)